VNRTSGKITNIRKSALPSLFILLQINIIFYFPQEFALCRFGWILSNFLLIKGTSKGSPQLWELFGQHHDHHLPHLAQQRSRQAGVSWEDDKMHGVQDLSLNLTSTGLQFVLGIDSGKVSGVDTTEGMSAWGQKSSSLPATVWATAKMNTQVILANLRSINVDNKVHKFFFCFSNFFYLIEDHQEHLSGCFCADANKNLRMFAPSLLKQVCMFRN